jgi:hypothetical protein
MCRFHHGVIKACRRYNRMLTGKRKYANVITRDVEHRFRRSVFFYFQKVIRFYGTPIKFSLINPLNAELNPICHLLVLLGDLTFMGLCIVSTHVYPTRCNVTQFIYIWKLLYMFRVVLPPIIRSAYNCIYSIWYMSHRYCYLPLSCKSWNRFECAVGGISHPEHQIL